MTKFLTYSVATLLLALYITVSSYIERGREITALQGEKNALLGKTSFLEKEIERRNEIEIQTSERLQELSRLAEEEKNKGGFDWTRSLPDDAVADKLRKD